MSAPARCIDGSRPPRNGRVWFKASVRTEAAEPDAATLRRMHRGRRVVAVNPLSVAFVAVNPLDAAAMGATHAAAT
ncbi:MAG: hypothetical protein R6U63_08580 [Longimicrobiales bacterium]